MSICILNQESKSCLPVKVITALQQEILPTNNKENIINKEHIINKIAKKMECNDTSLANKELCILKKISTTTNDKNLEEKIKKNIITYFKPVTKSYDKNHWLNNTEVDHIQHQFKTLFKGYYYSNIHMIDLVMFNPQHSNVIDYEVKCIKDINFINELISNCDNNILTYNGDLKYYGIVINTDKSTGGGIHWFSIFMDFSSKDDNEPYRIEYFNSSGYDIRDKSFKNYFINLADEITREVKKCEFVKVTDIQHQREDTANCGSYSLYYIWKRLNGTPYQFFSKNQILDENMVDFRKFLYRLK
jgi:hypothetical protein